jgi:hypothetical protein
MRVGPSARVAGGHWDPWVILGEAGRPDRRSLKRGGEIQLQIILTWGRGVG